MNSDLPSPDSGEIVPLPIGPELDLHTFRPRDLGELLPEYLAECRARGILEVRVIHGKGRGQVLRSVHALLARLPFVTSFALAGPAYGGTGATFVRLRPASAPEPATTDGGRSSGDAGTSRGESPDPAPPTP